MASIIATAQARADSSTFEFTICCEGHTWSFYLQQGQTPTGVQSDAFFYSMVPTSVGLTYDVAFLKSTVPAVPETTVVLDCDPNIISATTWPFFLCDIAPRVDSPIPFWTGDPNAPTFVPGVYAGGQLTTRMFLSPPHYVWPWPVWPS